MLVLITGGDWNSYYESQWNSYANNLKNLPVDMYSFSIGSTPSQDQLQGVISLNRNIFRVDSYDAADGRRPELVEAIRGGKAKEQARLAILLLSCCGQITSLSNAYHSSHNIPCTTHPFTQI